jgi:hypothetical protein
MTSKTTVVTVTYGDRLPYLQQLIERALSFYRNQRRGGGEQRGAGATRSVDGALAGPGPLIELQRTPARPMATPWASRPRWLGMPITSG